MKRWSRAGFGVLASAIFIAHFTLRPSSDDVSGIAQFCLVCGERSTADLLLNVLLFLPLGLSMAARGWSWRRAGVIGAIVALGIEVAQSAIPGRAPTWRDVAMNSGGSALGAWAWNATPRLIRAASSQAMAPAAAAGGVLFAAAGVVVTGWLLEPSIKRSEWYGLLAPRLSRLEHWSGRVDSAFVGAERIEIGLLSDAVAAQDAVAARAPIRIVAVAAVPSADLAPILMLADDVQEEMLLVGQDGLDLIVRERRRSSALRLFEPEHRIAGLFSKLAPGDSFTLELQLTDRALCARLGNTEQCAAALSGTAGWSTIYWRRGFSADAKRLLGAMTFAVLWIPFGLLVGAGRIGRSTALAGVAITLVVLAAMLSDLAVPTATEWSAAAVAALLAAVAARRIAVVTPAHSQ